MKRLALVSLALASGGHLMAQAPAFHTKPHAGITLPHSPLTLALTGVVLLGGLADDAVRHGSQEWRGPLSDGLASFGNEFGTGQRIFPLLGGVWMVSTLAGNERLQDISGHALQGAVAAGLAATAIKFLAGRHRPSSGHDADHFSPFRPGDTSFPSGHTALAFGIASALGSEFHGPWDDVAFYGLATLTGLARINDNRHWASDVAAGAVVGILAGRWATRGHRRLPISAGPGGVGFSITF